LRLEETKGKTMKNIALALLLATFALATTLGTAVAQDTCRSKAVGKDGKPLAGAALNSFLAKCAKDACEPKAVDKNGKNLSGAAKDSFMKKCQSEA
jgi:hypothetical protein